MTESKAREIPGTHKKEWKYLQEDENLPINIKPYKLLTPSPTGNNKEVAAQ
jgi:hypothetical protein